MGVLEVYYSAKFKFSIMKHLRRSAKRQLYRNFRKKVSEVLVVCVWSLRSERRGLRRMCASRCGAAAIIVAERDI